MKLSGTKLSLGPVICPHAGSNTALMNSLARPFANPLVQTSDFDSDAIKPMTLCVVPNAQEFLRFAVPAKYMELVRQFDGERTEEEAIQAFLADNPDDFTSARLHRLVHESLMPKGLIVYPHQDLTCAGTSNQNKRSFLFVKLPIIPPSVVDAVATHFAFLFQRPALILGLILFITSHIYVYAGLVSRHSLNLDHLDAKSILLIMLLSTLGTLCHEFGHASAAAHFGCRRMTIGWGIYIIYTVLWTNVSEAWRLPRRQRAIVDIGGVYFESLFLLLLLGLYIGTDNKVYLLSFIFIDLSIARTFNPFLRMDGYWLLSDLLGIVNLRQQQTAWYGEIISKVLGRNPPANCSNLSERARRILGIYSISTILFMTYLLYIVFTVVVLQVAAGLPGMIVKFVDDVSAGLPVLTLLGGAIEIIWRTLILLGTATLLHTLLTKARRMARQIRAVRASPRYGAA